MRTTIVLLCTFFSYANCFERVKRQAYELPDGAEKLVGSIKTAFVCPQDAVGYYADVENDCKIFHVCNSLSRGGTGFIHTRQYSFLCGNQTMFDQLSFTCASPEDSVPCRSAPEFYFLNEKIRIGDPNSFFLNFQDIQKASLLNPGLLYRYSTGSLSSIEGWKPQTPRPELTEPQPEMRPLSIRVGDRTG